MRGGGWLAGGAAAVMCSPRSSAWRRRSSRGRRPRPRALARRSPERGIEPKLPRVRSGCQSRPTPDTESGQRLAGGPGGERSGDRGPGGNDPRAGADDSGTTRDAGGGGGAGARAGWVRNAGTGPGGTALRPRCMGACAAMVGEAMRSGGFGRVVALLGRVLVVLTLQLDPASLVLQVVQRRMTPPDPLAVVLLLGLVGGAIYLWTRREPPE